MHKIVLYNWFVDVSCAVMPIAIESEMSWTPALVSYAFAVSMLLSPQ